MTVDLPNTEIGITLGVLAVALAVSLVRSDSAGTWIGWWERPLARIARRKKLAILAVTLLPIAVRLLLLPLFPVPQPRVHDEFSYLLAADTFLHGRLANPQHPMWVHFESMHILTHPVYASAFPLAPAAALALGRILLGHPWAGVCLATGLMCGAICWMLQGWLPPRWALLGALLIVLRIGISSYWMNSYWGGSVAAIGGALVLGALPRILRTPRWTYAATMGIGLAILANSRPFEGAVFGAIIALPLFAGLRRSNGPPVSVALRQVILPLALLLTVTAAGTGYYFARITGKPWVAPYVLYRATMTLAPHFIFQTPRPAPLYNNAEMRNFYVYDEIYMYRAARYSPLSNLSEKIAAYWRFFLGPLLTIPLVMLPFLWRDPRARMTLLIAAAFSLALVGQVWHNPHYAAPATGLMILIVILAMRRLQLWSWRRHRVGLNLARCLPLACALLFAIQTVEPAPSTVRFSWRWPAQGGIKRAGILRQLQNTAGNHLVFVRYDTTKHETGDEWVYNDADIDRARVVWARELDRESNAKLLRYFPARQVWLVEPDSASPRLIRYEDAPTRPMPFVQIGAPGIEVLRSPENLKRKILAQAQTHGQTDYSCDAWNAIFTEATGVSGPTASSECWGAGRSQPVTFDHWFTWAARQP